MIILAALLAAQAPSAPIATRPVAPPSVESNLRQRGLSEAGIAIVVRMQAEMGPQHERLMMADLENTRELSAALGASSPDVARIGALLRRQDSLRNERAALRTSALVRMLEAVPVPDRPILLRLYTAAQTMQTELPRPTAPAPRRPR